MRYPVAIIKMQLGLECKMIFLHSLVKRFGIYDCFSCFFLLNSKEFF